VGWIIRAVNAIFNNSGDKCFLTQPPELFQPLFQKSPYCAKITKVYTREEIEKINPTYNSEEIELDDLNYVAHFRFETPDAFLLGIDKIEDFYRFLQLCDRYSLEPALIEEEIINSYWIYRWVYENHSTWAKNMNLWNNDIDRGILECDIFDRTALNDLKKTETRTYAEPQNDPHRHYPGWTWKTTTTTTSILTNFPSMIKKPPATRVLPIPEENIKELLELCQKNKLPRVTKIITNLFASSIEWSWKGLTMKCIWDTADKQFIEWGLRFRYFCELSMAITENYGDEKYLDAQTERCLISLDQIRVIPGLSVTWYNTMNRNHGNKPVLVNSDIQKTPTLSIEKFEQRLKRIVGNLFDGIRWDGMVLCGSILPKCLYRWLPAEIKSKGFEQTDIDVMIQASSEIEFDHRVQQFYEDLLKNQPEARLLKELTLNRHKFYIEFPEETKIPKLDVFMVNHIGYVISRFHFGMVRMFYDGKQIWLFPSGIQSLCTLETSDIRWVSCKSDLKKTMAKYTKRGFKFRLSDSNFKKFQTYARGDPYKMSFRTWRNTDNDCVLAHFPPNGTKPLIKQQWIQTLLK